MTKFLSGTIWAYLSEFLLSALILTIFLLAIEVDGFTQFVNNSLSPLINLAICYVAVNAGLYVAAIQMLGGNFGSWMNAKKSASVFVNGFGVSLTIQFVCVLILLVSTIQSQNSCSLIAGFFFIYATVLLLTSLWNLCSLFKLKLLFESEFDRESRQQSLATPTNGEPERDE